MEKKGYDDEMARRAAIKLKSMEERRAAEKAKQDKEAEEKDKGE